MQSELLVDTRAYQYKGFVYVICGNRLFQVDENYFLELMPGNEVYGSIVRELKRRNPISHSELVRVLSKLMETIKEMM